MVAEIYKIVKSLQKHYRDSEIKEYLGKFNQNQEQENSIYQQAAKNFDRMVNNNEISDFINKKTSKENNKGK